MTTNGRTVLITGSTDGVGRYVAERLAAGGTRVIVHGRDRGRGEAVVERIAHEGGEARFLAADLSSLAEVRALADAVRNDGGGLDALVNNAGIGTSGAGRELSADGFELRFAVNYLAGFLLTRLLLPALERRESPRIVNVASAGQQSIDFSDVMLTRGYTAPGPIGRASWRKSCSPSISPRSSRDETSPSIACIRRPSWTRRWFA